MPPSSSGATVSVSRCTWIRMRRDSGMKCACATTRRRPITRSFKHRMQCSTSALLRKMVRGCFLFRERVFAKQETPTNLFVIQAPGSVAHTVAVSPEKPRVSDGRPGTCHGPGVCDLRPSTVHASHHGMQAHILQILPLGEFASLRALAPQQLRAN